MAACSKRSKAAIERRRNQKNQLRNTPENTNASDDTHGPFFSRALIFSDLVKPTAANTFLLWSHLFRQVSQLIISMRSPSRRGPPVKPFLADSGSRARTLKLMDLQLPEDVTSRGNDG